MTRPLGWTDAGRYKLPHIQVSAAHAGLLLFRFSLKVCGLCAARHFVECDSGCHVCVRHRSSADDIVERVASPGDARLQWRISGRTDGLDDAGR